MDSFDIMRNMNNENENELQTEKPTELKFCRVCGYEFHEEEIICPRCKSNKNISLKNFIDKKNIIREFVLKWGKIFVDIDTAFGVLFVILMMIFFWIAFFGSYVPNNNGYFEDLHYAPFRLLISIFVPIVILMAVIISKILIYVLLDIRDNLKEINCKLGKEDKNESLS